MNRRSRELAAMLACLLVAALAVRSVRARLFATERAVKEKHESYLLPPPKELVSVSLGYRAAVADILWAHTMVAQGLRLTERRRFENARRLFEAVNELDPTWRTPYLLAEAIITLQTVPVGYDEVVATRAILERGVRERPLDAEIWLHLGLFVGETAPSSYMDDHPELKKPWRREGADYLQRAAELGGGDSRIGWLALGGGSLLSESGDTEASIRFYEKQYAMTDDPDLRRDIEARLRRLERKGGQGKLETALGKRKEIDRLRAEELPWIGETTLIFLGPRPRARCAGLGNDERDCATTWREWAARFERQP